MDVEDSIPQAVSRVRFADVVSGTALVEGPILGAVVAGLAAVLFGRGAWCAGLSALCAGVLLAVLPHFLGVSTALDADQRAARSSGAQSAVRPAACAGEPLPSSASSSGWGRCWCLSPVW